MRGLEGHLRGLECYLRGLEGKLRGMGALMQRGNGKMELTNVLCGIIGHRPLTGPLPKRDELGQFMY